MPRRTILALATLAAIGLASLPGTASAHGGGHGGGGGGWHGGGWGWGGFGFYDPYWYGSPAYAPESCWRRVRVHTRQGWRWRRAWVCE